MSSLTLTPGVRQIALDTHLEVAEQHNGYTSSRHLDKPTTSRCKCGADLLEPGTRWDIIIELAEPNWHRHQAEVISEAVALAVVTDANRG